MTEPTLASRLVAGGAVVRSLTVDAGVATAIVTLSSSTEVGRFLENLRASHPRLELLARRTRDRPFATRETFSTAVESQLTDRQREVLQTAYRSGFFESPRANSAKEVTALLDISQPTFSYHLREAERRLCEFVFDGRNSANAEDTETQSR